MPSLPAALPFWGSLGDPHASRSAALLFFLPFLFPYYFLVYTDVLSWLLVLCALLATLERRHVLAALALALSIGVRQNNVVWAGFMPLLALWPTLQEAGWSPWRRAGEVARVAWPYARTEERRGGKEGGSTCRSRRSPEI